MPNKHRAHWSVMGIEPIQTKSAKQEDFEKFEHQLKIMIGKYGKTEVLTTVRQIYESEEPNAI